MKQRELAIFLPPPEKPKSRVKTYVQRAAVAAAAGTAAVYGNLIGDVILPYNQSVQEDVISDAYKTVYGTPFARVHCASPEYIADLLPGDTYNEVNGRGVPYTDTIWLSNETCENLAVFAESPPRPDHFEADSRHIMKQAKAIETAAHEGAHTYYAQWSEADAECSAAHDVADIAVALGMSADPELMDQFTRYTVSLQRELQMDMPETYNFDDCVLPAASTR